MTDNPHLPPMLPRVVSNDGREIWAWVSDLSKFSQENHELRTLRKQNADIKFRCGSCAFWMYSDACPREVHSNKTGRYSGPSSGAPICNKFQVKSYVADIIKENETRIAEIIAAREAKP